MKVDSPVYTEKGVDILIKNCFIKKNFKWEVPSLIYLCTKVDTKVEFMS